MIQVHPLLCFLEPFRSGPEVQLLALFLQPFPSLGLSPLPCSSSLAAAPFVLSSPSPLPATADECILQVCPPLLFPSAVRDGAPQTLTKLFVFGSESSYNILPAIMDFVCKNYRVYTHVLWLGPPLLGFVPHMYCN